MEYYVLNKGSFIEKAEIIREKGTNRSKFFRGEVDKYSWVDIGSSYLPSELQASYLYGQLQMQTNLLKKIISLGKLLILTWKDLESRGDFNLPLFSLKEWLTLRSYFLS